MSAKILFVDDDSNILGSFRRRLGRRYYVTTAMSGEQAVQVVREQGPFAVVVCDQRMRRVSGVDVLKAIREISPQTTRIMLTGMTDRGTELQARRAADPFMYLTKPCRTEDMVAAIKDGLCQYRFASEQAAGQTVAANARPTLRLAS